MSQPSSFGSERDQELAGLYRSAPQDEPQPALDAAIRAAARRAVGSRPRLTGAPFSGWRVPMSIAAVIVLSVSLVTLMREEAPELEQPPRAEMPESAAKVESKPAEPTLDAGQNAGTMPNIVARDAKQGGSTGLKPPRQAATPSVGLQTSRQPSALEPAATQESAASDRDDAASLLAKRAPAEAFPQGDGPRANATAPQPERRSAEELRRRDSGFAASPRLEAPAASPGVVESKSALKSEAAGADSGTREQTRALPQAAPTPARKPASAIAGATAAHADLPPQKWLEQIEALRKQGRGDEAKASFAEFRRRYPDYPLPDGLKDWERP